MTFVLSEAACLEINRGHSLEEALGKGPYEAGVQFCRGIL